MKLSKLFSLMKQHKSVQIRQGRAAQWVGDSSSLYPIYNLPHLYESAIQELLGVSDDAWDKFKYEEYETMKYSEEDNIDGMYQLDRLKITICWSGKELIPLVGGGKIFFIQAKYLKPFDDIGLLSFWYREEPLRDGVIGVNEGMCLAGLVMPIVVDDRLFVETLYRIYDLTKRQGGEAQ